MITLEKNTNYVSVEGYELKTNATELLLINPDGKQVKIESHIVKRIIRVLLTEVEQYKKNLKCGKCNDSKSLDEFLELAGQPKGSELIKEGLEYFENYIIECEELRKENEQLKQTQNNKNKKGGN